MPRLRCSIHTRFILNQVAAATGVSREELLSASIARRLSRPRQLAMWLIRRNTGHTLQRIGRVFHRHPSTVHHALQLTEQRLQDDPATVRQVITIEASLGRYATQPPLQETAHAHP